MCVDCYDGAYPLQKLFSFFSNKSILMKGRALLSETVAKSKHILALSTQI